MKPNKYGHFPLPKSTKQLHDRLVMRGDYSRISELIFDTNEYRNAIHAAISKEHGEQNIIEGIKKYYQEKLKISKTLK